MKRLAKIFLAILLFSTLYYSLTTLSKPSGYILDKNWTLDTNEKTYHINLPFYDYTNQSGTATFSTRFNRPSGNTLVIPKISCYAFKVFLNNTLIEQIGNTENYTANLWNYAHVINFDPQLLKDHNELIIETYTLDDMGMHIPPFIDKSNAVLSRITIYNIFNNDMHLIMFGISITISFIMFMITFKSKFNRNIHYLYMSISIVLISNYSMDCIYRIYSGTLPFFLLFRKLLFSFSYLSTIFFVLGIEKYTKISLKIRYVIFSFVGAAILIVFLSNDFISLRNAINILNVLMVLGPLYAIILLTMYEKTRLYFSVHFLTISLVYTVITVLFKGHSPYLFHFGVMIFSISTSMSLILEYTDMYKKNNELYKDSLIDPLTSAYNRKIFEQINVTKGDILILIDIDNFKYYNDTFGHLKGDQLLKEIVKIIKSHIRANDYIIRYGGDEFLIIIKNATSQAASEITQRICYDFNLKITDTKVDISFGIMEHDSDIETSIKKVDQLMYKMKFEKK